MQTNFLPGRSYAVGFLDCDDVMQWGEILRYEGNGVWLDSNDDEVASLYDPLLQMPVAVEAADGYALQA